METLALWNFSRPLGTKPLPVLADGADIDIRLRHPPEMIVESIGIDGVHGFLSTIEAVVNEWQQGAILRIMIVKKRTYMP